MQNFSMNVQPYEMVQNFPVWHLYKSVAAFYIFLFQIPYH